MRNAGTALTTEDRPVTSTVRRALAGGAEKVAIAATLPPTAGPLLALQSSHTDTTHQSGDQDHTDVADRGDVMSAVLDGQRYSDDIRLRDDSLCC